MTTAAPVRADWSHVTLGEYAALAVLTQPDPEAILNRVWDEIYEHNPFRGDTPTRLTDDGRAWLAELRTAAVSFDEPAAIVAARAFVKDVGTLVTMAARRQVNR